MSCRGFENILFFSKAFFNRKEKGIDKTTAAVEGFV
jgi:hypothetical protein